MNDTTYCILITTRCFLGGGGYGSEAIYHARRKAGFLSNTFSPMGSSRRTSLMHFQIYWRSLFIYFAFSEQASLETPPPQESLSLSLWCQKILSGS